MTPPTPPGPPGAPPPYGAPPSYGQPQAAPPGYAQQQPPYGQPQYPQPQYGQPQYPQPQYAPPQYPAPQYAQPQYAQPGAATSMGPGTTRMNKWIYRLFMLLGPMIGGALAAWGAEDSKVTELLYVAPIPIVLGIPFMYVFLYKMWAAIQDGQARTTPGKAIGFLFIPLFNYYWIFQVLPGYATDFNKFVDRHRVNAPKLSQGLILAAMFIPGVNVILWWILLGRICDGVNALPTTK